jgi:glycosyltransferase involved in cell wall biosynthesis
VLVNQSLSLDADRRVLTREHAPANWPRICVVGPLPPPAGGMANQCEQLVRLLISEGAQVELVRNNAPYRPAWVGRVPMLRALFRLVPYVVHVVRALGRVDLVHVLANSGWAWHLLTTPVLFAASLRGTPVIVNYRGGNADTFFARAPRHVLWSLRRVALRVTPSAFLQRVFAKYGLAAEVVPNIVDLTRFTPAPARNFGDAPHLVVARNLEPIYDMPTALRAFVAVRRAFGNARLTIAGTGPDRQALEALAVDLGVAPWVRFAGRIDNVDMPHLYAAADCALNPSRVDNMPISLLEAFASGVPVVSTDAGGIPDMVEHGVNGLLVPAGNAEAMAREVVRVLQDAALRERLVRAGLEQVRRYAWPEVRDQWRAAYWRAAASRNAVLKPGKRR